MYRFKLLLAGVLLGATTLPLSAQVAFSLSSSPSVGNNPRAVIAVDVNGDGKPDLVSANQNSITANSLTVLINDGAGGFPTSATLSTGSQPYSVAAADFTGDGKMDLVCANYGGNSITVFRNNGSGGFSPLITVPVGTRPKSVTVADVNSDGRPDIICANSSSSTLSILLNEGSGYYFTSVDSSPATGTGPACVTAADVNGDGKVDLVVANLTDTVHAFTVLTNDGTGKFAAAPVPNNFFKTSWVTVADVNHDGFTDVICLGSGATGNAVSIYTNNGTGAFTLASSATTGSTPYAVASADINGDGHLDLITANQGNNTMTILTNNGSGGFALALSPTVGSGPESLAVGDVNGDGKLDLITCNWNNATLSVMTNNTALPPPRLDITRTANALVVKWPSPSTGWTLIQNSDLATSNWWAPGGVLDDGNTKSFTLGLPAGNSFFRLTKP